MKKIFVLATLMVAMCGTLPVQAQSSLKDLLQKAGDVVQGLTGGSNVSAMPGTWTYTGSCVELKSDNVLQKAGGKVATAAVEKQLDEKLAKVGITEGEMQYIFAQDSTFTMKWGKKQKTGTYSYDAATEKIALKYGRLITIHCKVNCTSSQMDMLFEADKLLKLLTFLGNKSGNATLKSISSLADSYDGMRLGFSMKKEE